jgi:O-antigen ligase
MSVIAKHQTGRFATRQRTLPELAGEYRNPLVKASVVVGVLALSAAGGWLASLGLDLSLALLAGVAGAFSLFIAYRLRRYEYGILSIALSAGLLNFVTIPTGTESRIVISLLIALGLMGIWFLQSILTRPHIQLVPSPINVPLLAFVVVSVVSFVWSILLRDPLVSVPGKFVVVQGAALVVNIGLPLLALFVANQIKEVKWLQYLTWIIIALGVLRFASEQFNLPTSRLIDNGSRGLFPTWVAAHAYAQALFNERLSRWWRGALLLVLAWAVYLYFVVHDDWFSGWLPLGVACIVITWQRSRKLFVVAALIGLVVLVLRFDYYFNTLYQAQVDDGDLQRLDLWAINLHHVSNHLLFGMGPAGHTIYNMTYNPAEARSTHNNYFDVLAQTGVIGFAVFLWLLATLLRVGWHTTQLIAKRLDFESAFANATFAGCIGACVSMMLGDWVLPFAYNQTITGFDNASYTWLCIGGMVSLYLMLTHHAAAPPLPAETLDAASASTADLIGF